MLYEKLLIICQDKDRCIITEIVIGKYYRNSKYNNCKNKIGMEEIQRVWRDTVWKKILFADERKGI